MVKIVLLSIVSLFFSGLLLAQAPTKQDLERERQQLKREIEQAQELLDKNKKNTKENLVTLTLLNKKLNLQGSVIENISKDINRLDNSIYKSQKDINKLQLLLDTLKQEYAKSMVYAYKNRSSSDFLNFIFSSSSFNDAIKRITYLKSYRNYREMQGDSILRTQQLLKERIDELSGSKKSKGVVLQTQSKELSLLESQQQEKNQLLAKLKTQGKELNNQIAAKKKQMQKVGNAIAAAIKRAQDLARKEALENARVEKAKRDAEEKAAIAENKSSGSTAPTKPPITRPAKPATTPNKSILLGSDADVKLNANFLSNRGSLPWPVERGFVSERFGPQKLEIGVVVDNPGITITSDIGTAVKALFDGEVAAVTSIEGMQGQVVVLKHGAYFTTYSNLSGISVARGQSIKTGQVLGRVAADDDGDGAILLIISNERGNQNPESWLRRR